MKTPKRKYELTIKIGANSWAGVMKELGWAVGSVAVNELDANSVLGGPDSNHIVAVEHNPEMTPEAYEAEVKAYDEWAQKNL
jgi:hypothetical protein